MGAGTDGAEEVKRESEGGLMLRTCALIKGQRSNFWTCFQSRVPSLNSFLLPLGFLVV